MPVNFVLCFRAKEKMDLRGEKPKTLGWMPIAGEEFVYESTLTCLLYPGSNGVPSWHPDEMGEKATIKCPGQFRDILKDKVPLSADVGEKLARWAQGDASGVASPAPTSEDRKREPDTVKSVGNEIWEMMGRPGNTSWFVDKFGKMRADCTLAELIEFRNLLELERDK